MVIMCILSSESVDKVNPASWGVSGENGDLILVNGDPGSLHYWENEDTGYLHSREYGDPLVKTPFMADCFPRSMSTDHNHGNMGIRCMVCHF